MESPYQVFRVHGLKGSGVPSTLHRAAPVGSGSKVATSQESGRNVPYKGIAKLELRPDTQRRPTDFYLPSSAICVVKTVVPLHF